MAKSSSFVSATAAWPAGKVSASVSGGIDAADVADPTVTCFITIQFSFDDGNSWVDGPKANWQGGQTDPRNGNIPIPPGVSVTFQSIAQAPDHIRISATFNKPVTIDSSTLVITLR